MKQEIRHCFEGAKYLNIAPKGEIWYYRKKNSSWLVRMLVPETRDRKHQLG